MKDKVTLEGKDYINYLKMMESNLGGPRIKILELLKDARMTKIDGLMDTRQVSNGTNISKPLLAFHMNGIGRRHPRIGLIDLGLVDKEVVRRKVFYRLSPKGKEILQELEEIKDESKR